MNNILQNIMALMLPLVGDVGAPLSTETASRLHALLGCARDAADTHRAKWQVLDLY